MAQRQDPRSGLYRRVLEERDRIELLRHHGCHVGRFAGRIMNKGRRVISHALHGHRTLQESGRASGYRRFREKGRMAPDGLDYVESGVETSFDRCFQLMECADLRLLEQWADRWRDLVDFEFVAVRLSKEAAELISVEL